MAAPRSGLIRSGVLAYIGARGRASRVELARHLEASPALITQTTKELLKEGLICQCAEEASTGGRPAQLLELTRNGGAALGLKIASDHLTAVEVDLSGTISRTRREPFDAGSPTAISDIERFLSDVIESRGKEAPLLGVGIGVPGSVDAQDNGVVESTMLNWRTVPLGARLRSYLELPVIVENNVNALATAQSLYGQLRNINNALVVTVGEGIGAGVIVDGVVVRGEGGGAGQLGHFPTVEGGPICQCGNFGCLEALIGAQGVLERAIQSGAVTPGGSLDDLAIEAKRGNDDAVAVFEWAGHLLGRAVAAAVNLLSSEAIVISGEGVAAWQHWEVGFELGFRSALVPGLRGIPVFVEAWQDERWAQGAASLVLCAPFDVHGTSGEQGQLVRDRLGLVGPSS